MFLGFSLFMGFQNFLPQFSFPSQEKMGRLIRRPFLFSFLIVLIQGFTQLGGCFSLQSGHYLPPLEWKFREGRHLASLLFCLFPAYWCLGAHRACSESLLNPQIIRSCPACVITSPKEMVFGVSASNMRIYQPRLGLSTYLLSRKNLHTHT